MLAYAIYDTLNEDERNRSIQIQFTAVNASRNPTDFIETRQLSQQMNKFERVNQFDGFYTEQFEEEDALLFIVA